MDDDADFSNESTAGVKQWKEWILRRIEDIGVQPASADSQYAGAEHIRDLREGLKEAEAELARRGQGTV